jgi:hypothetical protein
MTPNSVNLQVFEQINEGRSDLRSFMKGKDIFVRLKCRNGFYRQRVKELIRNPGKVAILLENAPLPESKVANDIPLSLAVGNIAGWINLDEIAEIKFVTFEDLSHYINMFQSTNMNQTMPNSSIELDPKVVLTDKIITGLNLQTDLAKAAVSVMLRNIEILDKKQQDYGSNNLTKFGVRGIVVRSNDKLERLITLTDPKRATPPNNESLADTFLDLSNYGLIGYLMQTKIWPNQ